MNIRKISGALAAAIASLGLAGIAQANDVCQAEIDDIKIMAGMLRCDENGGSWVYDPIWQKKGKRGNGCEVHKSLAAQLDEKRPDDGSPPKRNKKGSNDAKGAANSLENHKFEDALLHLQNFQITIEESARLNEDPDATMKPGADAAGWAEYFRQFGETMEARVAACMPVL